MRTQEELKDLFTTYFSDRLSPPQIDCLVSDVLAAAQNRRPRSECRREPDCAADD
jgi:hypothetical protein